MAVELQKPSGGTGWHSPLVGKISLQNVLSKKLAMQEQNIFRLVK